MFDMKRIDELNGWATYAGAAKALGISVKAVRYRVMRYRCAVVRLGKNDMVRLNDLKHVSELMRSEGK